MAAGEDSSEKENAVETSEGTKKRWKINGLIFIGIIALSALLPQKYKGLGPLLLLIPVVLSVVGKMRTAEDNPGALPGDQTYSPPMHHPADSHEPYSYRPKDPKDPRKYKPIG